LENTENPKWLQKLQLNSWEPEILLSGIVLYGMFKTPELLDQLYSFIEVNIALSVNDIKNFISLLKLAIHWLIFGLILHLISRGIWVGMVGLSFTFPKGIDQERLKFDSKFRNHIDRIPSMQRIIISLEKICSSLFSISFMLFMSMIGAYFYFLVLLIIPIMTVVYLFMNGNFESLNNPIWVVYVITVVVLGFIALIDFLTLGWIKRFKWLARMYYPLYRLIGFITLSRFYRPIYYSIISNLSRWKISLILIAFTVVSIYALDKNDSEYPGENFSGISMWSDRIGSGAYYGYYDDQMQDEFSGRAQIQSDVISGNTLRLFVVLRADNEERIRKHCNYDSLVTKLDTATRHIQMHCLDAFYKIYIDDSLIQDLKWKFHYKTTTRQKGILTWINIRQLPEGLHELELRHPLEKRNQVTANIPFFREYPNGVINLKPSANRDDKEDYMDIKPVLPK
jgi:hypothetical protein